MSTLRVAAFIPARGGSKRVPGKNMQEVGGVTLVTRAVRAAVGAGCHAVISTDDTLLIADAIHEHKVACLCGRAFDAVTIHERPAPLASDHAQIEDAIAHWWRRLATKPDAIVILQPTSPFRTSEHVKAAIALLHGANLDSVVSVTRSAAPHFAGRLKPREAMVATVNRDVEAAELLTAADASAWSHAAWYEWQPFGLPSASWARPRTQDLPPRGHENGAIYAFTREHWERSSEQAGVGNRMGGRMAALPMTWIEGLDVDTPEDLAAARAIAEGMGI